MTDDLTKTLETLREPATSTGWADAGRLRRAAVQRRRRRAGLISAVATVCAAAVVVPLLTRGPSSTAYHGPLAVGEREGVAYQLVGNTTDATASPVDVSTTEQALALTLLRLQLDGDDPNPVSSAMSLSIALSMLNLGARGETSQQIARLIGPAGASAPSIAAGWRDLMGDMAASAVKSKIALDSANSIWQQKDFPLTKQFVDDLTTYLYSGVWQVDFTAQPDRAADAINHWVADKTHGKITKLVGPEEIQTWVLAIVNAVYFKAPWQVSFEDKTVKRPFLTDAGKAVPVNMVTGRIPAQFGGAFGELTAVQVPYAGKRFAALILEPQKQSLREFTASLTPASLNTIVQGLRTPHRPGEFTMPALHLSTTTPLDDTLKSLGMTRAFQDNAQLQGLSPQGTKVAEVKQMATLDVNARGTEAAAATVIGVVPTSATAAPPVIDHPYLFLIRDTQTGTILFSAAVQDPTRG